MRARSTAASRSTIAVLSARSRSASARIAPTSASCCRKRGLPMVRLATIANSAAPCAAVSAATLPPPGAGAADASRSR